MQDTSTNFHIAPFPSSTPTYVTPALASHSCQHARNLVYSLPSHLRRQRRLPDPPNPIPTSNSQKPPNPRPGAPQLAVLEARG